MKVATVEVSAKKNDSMQKLVAAQGFPAKDWKKIYDAPYNRPLKKKRSDPNKIMKGDKFHVPRYKAKDVAELMKQIHAIIPAIAKIDHAIKQEQDDWRALSKGFNSSTELFDLNTFEHVDRMRVLAKVIRDTSVIPGKIAVKVVKHPVMKVMKLAIKLDERNVRRLEADADSLMKALSANQKVSDKLVAAIGKLIAQLKVEQSALETQLKSLVGQLSKAAASPY